jgi:hypothetical protein
MVTSVIIWILFELQLKIHFFIFVMLCHFYFFLDLRFYFALRGCFHHDLVLLVCARVSHELSSFGLSSSPVSVPISQYKVISAAQIRRCLGWSCFDCRSAC